MDESNSERLDKEYGMRPEAVSFPMMLVLSFVYPCNAKCPHCPYTNSNIRDDFRDVPLMPEGTFKKIADEAGKYNSYLRISGGGEPMLHKKAVELLIYAKKAGCRIGLITNGSKFTASNSRALLEAGVDMIEFSVDADNPKHYEKVREGLKWDVLLKNVRRMLEIRKEIGETCESKIVASGVNQIEVDIDKVATYWTDEVGVDNFIKRKFLTWGDNTELDDSRSADRTPYLDTNTVPCPFIFERLNIDTRGNVMVCGYDISSATNMGNVNEENIRDIWHGDAFQYYRGKHLSGCGKDIDMCANCPDWKYRSWTHNYWKVVKDAEESRSLKFSGLNDEDDFQMIVDK